MTEQHRHECECRAWLEITDGNPDEIKALLRRIAKRRGQEAADRLREGMREAWRNR